MGNSWVGHSPEHGEVRVTDQGNTELWDIAEEPFSEFLESKFEDVDGGRKSRPFYLLTCRSV